MITGWHRTPSRLSVPHPPAASAVAAGACGFSVCRWSPHQRRVETVTTWSMKQFVLHNTCMQHVNDINAPVNLPAVHSSAHTWSTITH